MKTKEELIALKAEYESINKKLSELTDDEMEQVTGGFIPPYPPSSFGGSKEEYTIERCTMEDRLTDLTTSDMLLGINARPMPYYCTT